MRTAIKELHQRPARTTTRLNVTHNQIEAMNDGLYIVVIMRRWPHRQMGTPNGDLMTTIQSICLPDSIARRR